jgi:hypothetical protein
MGKLANGINSAFEGKVGSVVGSSWKGIPYIKSAYKKRTKKISEKELANRKKFGMAQYWLKPLLPFVREGFKGFSPTVEGYVAAKSYLLHNCFSGTPPDISIDPSLMKISYGDLPLPANIKVKQGKNGSLQFTWNKVVVAGTSAQDQVMMLAYDVDNKIAFYNLTGQFRSAGTDALQVDATRGRRYQLYLAFTAADRSRQSDSVYLGELKIG